MGAIQQNTAPSSFHRLSAPADLPASGWFLQCVWGAGHVGEHVVSLLPGACGRSASETWGGVAGNATGNGESCGPHLGGSQGKGQGWAQAVVIAGALSATVTMVTGAVPCSPAPGCSEFPPGMGVTLGRERGAGRGHGLGHCPAGAGCAEEQPREQGPWPRCPSAERAHWGLGPAGRVPWDALAMAVLGITVGLPDCGSPANPCAPTRAPRPITE